MSDDKTAQQIIEGKIHDLMSMVFASATMTAENDVDELISIAEASGILGPTNEEEMATARSLIMSGMSFAMSALLSELATRKLIDEQQVLVQSLTL